MELIDHYAPKVSDRHVPVLFFRVPSSRLSILHLPIHAAISSGAETVVCYEMRRGPDGKAVAENLNKRVTGAAGDIDGLSDRMAIQPGDYVVCVIGGDNYESVFSRAVNITSAWCDADRAAQRMTNNQWYSANHCAAPTLATC